MSFALRLPVTPEEEALDPSIPLRTGGGNPAGALPGSEQKKTWIGKSMTIEREVARIAFGWVPDR